MEGGGRGVGVRGRGRRLTWGAVKRGKALVCETVTVRGGRGGARI